MVWSYGVTVPEGVLDGTRIPCDQILKLTREYAYLAHLPSDEPSERE
jgi:hypothetical protein